MARLWEGRGRYRRWGLICENHRRASHRAFRQQGLAEFVQVPSLKRPFYDSVIGGVRDLLPLYHLLSFKECFRAVLANLRRIGSKLRDNILGVDEFTGRVLANLRKIGRKLLGNFFGVSLQG